MTVDSLQSSDVSHLRHSRGSMDKEDALDLLEQIVPPVVQTLGLELVGLEVQRNNRTLMIEVFADRPRGGITIDECAAINRQVVNKIEEGLLIADDYSLAVSSPGLDWPLKTDKDFLRTIDRPVRFHLAEAIDGKIEYSGTVRRVEGENVMVELNEKEIAIPIKGIRKAVQVI